MSTFFALLGLAALGASLVILFRAKCLRAEAAKDKTKALAEHAAARLERGRLYVVTDRGDAA